jgi:hypothetical protein
MYDCNIIIVLCDPEPFAHLYSLKHGANKMLKKYLLKKESKIEIRFDTLFSRQIKSSIVLHISSCKRDSGNVEALLRYLFSELAA